MRIAMHIALLLLLVAQPALSVSVELAALAAQAEMAEHCPGCEGADDPCCDDDTQCAPLCCGDSLSGGAHALKTERLRTGLVAAGYWSLAAAPGAPPTGPPSDLLRPPNLI